MKKMTIGLLIIAFVPLLVLWIGCERGKPIEEIERREIKIGGAVPLSGPGAYWAKPIIQGWKDGAEVINARGGVKIGDTRGDAYKLKIITYDTKGTEADSKAATTRLIEEDKVKYIFSQGVINTSGMLEITEPKKVLSIVACKGFPRQFGLDYFYHFRAEMPDYELGFAYVPFIKEYYPDIKTAAFIGPDDKDGYDCYQSYKRLMEYFNIEDLGKEYFEWETTDFDPIVVKVLVKKPDCIITSPTPPGITATIVKTARKSGYRGPIVSPAVSEIKTILEVAGEFADDVVLPMTLESPQTEYQKALSKRFTTRFGDFNDLAGNYSWWVYALEKAFEKAGTFEDTRAVANALQDVVLEDTYVGKTCFGGKGAYGLKRQGIYDCYTTLIEDGKARIADVRSPALPPGY